MAVSGLSDIDEYRSAYPRVPLEEPPRADWSALASNASTTRRAASLQPMEAAAHAAEDEDAEKEQEAAKAAEAAP